MLSFSFLCYVFLLEFEFRFDRAYLATQAYGNQVQYTAQIDALG